MRSMDMDTWIDSINDGKPCDELALLTLSAMYHRHSLVVTKNKTWCTIESPTPLNLLQAMSACTVRLLYLGDLNFGVLKWKPQIPKPVTAKPNRGEFKIVEEDTIDKQQSTFKKLAMVKPTPVETAQGSGQSSTSTDCMVPEHEDLQSPAQSSANTVVQPTLVETAECAKQSGVPVCMTAPAMDDLKPQLPVPVPSPVKDKPVKLTVVYAAENTDFYMGTSPAHPKWEPQLETVSSDSYPWKKKLCVSVRRLSDFEISYWSGGFNQDREQPIKMEPSPEKDMVVLKQETDPDDVPPHISEAVHSHSHLEKEPEADAKTSASPGDQTTEKLLAHAKSLTNVSVLLLVHQMN